MAGQVRRSSLKDPLVDLNADGIKEKRSLPCRVPETEELHVETLVLRVPEELKLQDPFTPKGNGTGESPCRLYITGQPRNHRGEAVEIQHT